MIEQFKLSDVFIEKYKTIKPPFGFNGLGELVFMRSYSRLKEDGKNEFWWETIRRVVEGTFNMQKNWIDEHRLGWNKAKGQKSAQEMYDRIFHMKFLPPGRGLWAMGSFITEEKKLYASLNNCSFVSTENIKEELAKPFCFLMDMSMLGVGVGFDTRGAGKIEIEEPRKDRIKFEIPDTREGWVESVRLLIESYFNGTPGVDFDYSKIRKEGEPIKGFGGTSSGPKPLQDCHEMIRKTLDRNIDKPISITTIVDIMNLIGKCVVSGNVRRSSEIVFGDANSEEFLDLKNYKKNPHRKEYGWNSNNSIFAKLGMDYTNAAERTKLNGEPGYIWLENAKAYSRMNNGADNRDHRVVGANPCLIGSTLIAVADGRNAVQIKDLVGTIYPVYSIGESGAVTIQQAVKTWKTRDNAEVWKLTLDDGSEVIATPDHKMMLRNGTYTELKDLVAGQSLMPFNSYASTQGYRNISLNRKLEHSGYKRQYRMIVESKGVLIDPKEQAILHIDFNRQTASFQNLKIMSKEDHDRYHSDRIKGPNNPIFKVSEDVRKKLTGNILNEFGNKGEHNPWYGNTHSKKSKSIIGEKSKQNWESQRDVMVNSIKEGMSDPEVRKKISDSKRARTIWVDFVCPVCGKVERLTEYRASKSKTCSHACSNILRARLKQEKLYNHKVAKVEFYGYEDVYDITVENTHNFGIISSKQDANFVTSSGIFVHNCSEQSLENMELCTLVETFPARHDSLEDYLITLKYAYLYAKTVTLGKTHWPETNRVMLRNRRIGCSMSGIAQFITNKGLDELRKWCEVGYQKLEQYDTVYSDWLAIPKSIKKTSIKPSGSVSLLAGATPGLHYPESRYYIRRVRLGKTSDLVEPLKRAGYKLEPCKGSEETTLVVEIPVCVDEKIKTIDQVSMWEQLSLAAFMQKYWSDNQVSCTVTFQKHEADQIAPALNYFQYQLKGISFLPKLEEKAYEQMPYEAIDEKTYDKMIEHIKPIKFKEVEGEKAEVERFCNNDTCTLT